MDSQTAITLLLPTALFTLLILLLLKKLSSQKSSIPKRLPPGPWKLPIIGNLHQLTGEHLHRRLQRLACAHGPLFRLKLGEIDLNVITSSELVHEVFRTHDLKFSSRPKLIAGKIFLYNYSDFGLAPYGKIWSQLRKICTMELLSPMRVKSSGSIREKEGYNLVHKIRMAAGSPVNLSKMLLSTATTSLARAALGKASTHEESFVLEIEKASKYLSGLNLVDLFPWLSFLAEITGFMSGMKRVHRKLDAILDEIIREHESKNCEEGDELEEDLLDVFLRIKKSGGLDFTLRMENIKAVILDLFLAGTDSISITLEWAITELVRHPEIMQKAQLEIRRALHGKIKIEEEDINKLPYLNQVIKEVLRLHPPGPLLAARLCSETVELAGYTIPKESRVVINAWAIMRDPKHWKDPERFWPERFHENGLDFGAANFEFIPFGGGRRGCPGMPYALASIGYWLALLLFYFDWELPEGKKPKDLDIEEAFDLSLGRKNNLVLVATYNH